MPPAADHPCSELDQYVVIDMKEPVEEQADGGGDAVIEQDEVRTIKQTSKPRDTRSNNNNQDNGQELIRRLNRIEVHLGIPVNLWNWRMLEWLENHSGDLWQLLVVASILLARADVRGLPQLHDQRQATAAALSFAVKILYDQRFIMRLCSLATEVNFAQRLGWRINVQLEEYTWWSHRLVARTP